ncbi:hypothetical protein CPB85DRAFT_1257016 [Mucidula mucida]|nr:hypothetical protein CPB85DRAFT_1257016 [Mucidula mucida]
MQFEEGNSFANTPTGGVRIQEHATIKRVPWSVRCVQIYVSGRDQWLVVFCASCPGDGQKQPAGPVIDKLVSCHHLLTCSYSPCPLCELKDALRMVYTRLAWIGSAAKGMLLTHPKRPLRVAILEVIVTPSVRVVLCTVVGGGYHKLPLKDCVHQQVRRLNSETLPVFFTTDVWRRGSRTQTTAFQLCPWSVEVKLVSGGSALPNHEELNALRILVWLGTPLSSKARFKVAQRDEDRLRIVILEGILRGRVYFSSAYSMTAIPDNSAHLSRQALAASNAQGFINEPTKESLLLAETSFYRSTMYSKSMLATGYDAYVAGRRAAFAQRRARGRSMEEQTTRIL